MKEDGVYTQIVVDLTGLKKSLMKRSAMVLIFAIITLFVTWGDEEQIQGLIGFQVLVPDKLFNH